MRGPRRDASEYAVELMTPTLLPVSPEVHEEGVS